MSGCDAELTQEQLGSGWGWLTIWEPDLVGPEGPLVPFCTPRCAYDFMRRLYEKEVGEAVEPDLLEVVAIDLFEALGGVEDLSEGMSDEKAELVSECWARLGHVLGQLDLTPRPVDE